MKLRLGTALGTLVGLLAVSTVAFASFTSSGSAVGSFNTATLQPPTNPALQAGTCTNLVADSITVTWTRTSSTWADGYEVLAGLLPGGPYTVSKLVAGQATESTTVTGLNFLTTYYFVVKSTKGTWRSAPSAEVSRTTRSTLCT